MFRPVSSKLNVILQEEQTLNFWRLHRISDKAGQQRQGQAEFIFYERPAVASGRPEMQHAQARLFKDVFPRYKLMRGFHVARRSGWEAHGLPVETGVEKQLGFTSKSQIEAYGVERFNELCRKSAFDYIREWERFSDRIAFWVDMEEAYVTYTNEYIESLWWILKTLWGKGLLYQGYQVVPYCPRCGTPLSDHEAALGNRETVDPSVYVRLPLVDEPGTSLLVWTTTPWALPGNVAVAINPEIEYVTVRRGLPEGGSERLILARSTLESVFGDQPVSVIDSFKGKKLKGRRYQPLFTFLHTDKPAYYVILQDFISGDDGTGLVNTAPAFGVEDLQAALAFNLPVLVTVAEDGAFIPEVRPWSGKFFKDADPYIIQDLQARGLLFRHGSLTHTSPFCWHCDSPLLYYARSAWRLRTSQYKERLAALNQQIKWAPEQIKHGCLGSWLEDNVDWTLGRERFWGAPLPVWECQRCHHQLAVGSLSELSQLAGRDLSGLDLHRPYVDQVTFPCPACATKKEVKKHTAGAQEEAGSMQRAPELVDVWFDAGAMPAAQWHFPFENRETFRRQFPADFTCEAVDQSRGWFYMLHTISALLFDSVAFKNAICLGPVLDASGQEMSTSRDNLVDPWDVLNAYGADAFRWYLYTVSPPGQERRFSVDLVGEALRRFTPTLWNVYAFFVTYANLDGWQPAHTPGPAPTRGEGNLDRWLRSELHALIREVTDALENYDVTGATRPIQAFVDDLSKWYLHRSRRRFLKSASTDSQAADDKHSAYTALYETLVVLSKLLAPTMPFLAEALYQNLVRSVDTGAPESVHLSDWPAHDPSQIDRSLNADMRLVMKLASLGHAAREQAGIKRRQPLSEAAFALSKPDKTQFLEQYADLLLDELDVKSVRLLSSAGEAVSYSLKPLSEQLDQKYKGLFPKVSQAISELDASQAGPSLQAGDAVKVTIEGITLDLQPGEVEVHSTAQAGFAAASEGGYLVALKTGLTPALRREGLAREFVHRIQELRKQAELEIADRIQIYITATPGLLDAIQAHRDEIMGETLALEIIEGEAPAQVVPSEAWFDGQWMKVGVQKGN